MLENMEDLRASLSALKDLNREAEALIHDEGGSNAREREERLEKLKNGLERLTKRLERRQRCDRHRTTTTTAATMDGAAADKSPTNFEELPLTLAAHLVSQLKGWSFDKETPGHKFRLFNVKYFFQESDDDLPSVTCDKSVTLERYPEDTSRVLIRIAGYDNDEQQPHLQQRHHQQQQRRRISDRIICRLADVSETLLSKLAVVPVKVEELDDVSDDIPFVREEEGDPWFSFPNAERPLHHGDDDDDNDDDYVSSGWDSILTKARPVSRDVDEENSRKDRRLSTKELQHVPLQRRRRDDVEKQRSPRRDGISSEGRLLDDGEEEETEGAKPVTESILPPALIKLRLNHRDGLISLPHKDGAKDDGDEIDDRKLPFVDRGSHDREFSVPDRYVDRNITDLLDREFSLPDRYVDRRFSNTSDRDESLDPFSDAPLSRLRGDSSLCDAADRELSRVDLTSRILESSGGDEEDKGFPNDTRHSPTDATSSKKESVLTKKPKAKSTKLSKRLKSPSLVSPTSSNTEVRTKQQRMPNSSPSVQTKKKVAAKSNKKRNKNVAGSGRPSVRDVIHYDVDRDDEDGLATTDVMTELLTNTDECRLCGALVPLVEIDAHLATFHAEEVASGLFDIKEEYGDDVQFASRKRRRRRLIPNHDDDDVAEHDDDDDDDDADTTAKTTTTTTILQPCRVCEKEIGYQDAFDHMQTAHLLADQCPFCPGTYRKLKLHVSKVHNPKPALYCEVCGACFRTHSSLKGHRLNRHFKDQKRHVCDVCSTSFAFAYMLNNHKRALHEGIKTSEQPKNFVCDVCDRAFRTHELRRRHRLRVHTPELGEFVCNDCGKIMTDRQGFNNHILIHREARDFVCDVCSKAFRTSKNLHQHKLSHLPPRHECPHCQKKFIYACGLRAHKKQVHDNPGGGAVAAAVAAAGTAAAANASDFILGSGRDDIVGSRVVTSTSLSPGISTIISATPIDQSVGRPALNGLGGIGCLPTLTTASIALGKQQQRVSMPSIRLSEPDIAGLAASVLSSAALAATASFHPNGAALVASASLNPTGAAFATSLHPHNAVVSISTAPTSFFPIVSTSAATAASLLSSGSASAASLHVTGVSSVGFLPIGVPTSVASAPLHSSGVVSSAPVIPPSGVITQNDLRKVMNSHELEKVMNPGELTIRNHHHMNHGHHLTSAAATTITTATKVMNPAELTLRNHDHFHQQQHQHQQLQEHWCAELDLSVDGT